MGNLCSRAKPTPLKVVPHDAILDQLQLITETIKVIERKKPRVIIPPHPLDYYDKLTDIKGIGKTTEEKLTGHGISNVDELISYYLSVHRDCGQVQDYMQTHVNLQLPQIKRLVKICNMYFPKRNAV